MLEPFVVLVDTQREVYGDTNCACPTDETFFQARTDWPPHNQFYQSLWICAPDLVVRELQDGSAACFNPTGSAGVVVLGSGARSILESFRSPRSLPAASSDARKKKVRSVAEALAQVELIVPFPVQHRRFSGETQTLTAWLHVTNACNLRCTYCYIHKSNESMDSETGRRALEAVFRSAQRNGFTRVKVKYAGGEATLRPRLIAELHTYAHHLQRTTGVALREVVLSNGVGLTPHFLRFLRETHIGLVVSLDGVGVVHDQQRAFANGHGSFFQVVRTLDGAQKVGLEPFLSITVTAANATSLSEAVAFALDRGLRFNLNFYRDHTDGVEPAALRAEEEQLIQGVQEALRVIEERLPPQRMIDLLVDRSNFLGPHEHACGMGSSYLVIDHSGGIAACQMEMERPVTSIAAADPLAEFRRHEIPLANPSVTEKEGCEACTWRFWCAGGCPLLSRRVLGRADVRSPYCHVYQAIYPALIRIEGLRLARWGQPVAGSCTQDA